MTESSYLYTFLSALFILGDIFCFWHFLRGEGLIFVVSVAGAGVRFVPGKKVKSWQRVILLLVILLLSTAIMVLIYRKLNDLPPA